MGGSGTRSCGRTNHESANFLNITALSCTLTWRLSSQLETESSSRTTLHVTRLGLCWSRGAYWMYLHFIPTTCLGIFNSMSTHLGCHGAAAQSSNTTMSEYSDLRGPLLRHLDTTSPVMYQKLVASMPRRVAAVLKAKGGAMRY
ncbi:hypothetical protein AVEN_44375-1 [Araneus ventricosus]|uniref:Uncharacterized protein n=1 Tax=Araneus ventricosus TaxID=182803 RepID=A0A4Y2QR97_ARAVE|nr:hypothetical protein AVEN_44375-1 [Araneus ventricosus]